LRRLRQLEEENRKLKQLVADLSLDEHILRELVRKSSGARREAGWSGSQWFEIGSRRACGLVLMNRATLYYRNHAKDCSALKMRPGDEPRALLIRQR
jgi:hypothetical protein